MKKIVAAVTLIIGVFLINSCEQKIALPPASNTGGGGGGGGLPPGCDTTHLTYSSGTNNVNTIINTQCAVSGCHVPRGGAGANNFNSYSGVVSETSGGKSSIFYIRISGTSGGNLMPNVPQPGWDPCMLYQLQQWVLDGAPQ